MRCGKFITFLLSGILCVTACEASEDDVVTAGEETGGTEEPDSGSGSGSDSGSGGGTTVTSPDYSRLTSSNHPRVVYTDADFETIVQVVAAGNNSYLNTMHNMIINRASSYVGASDLEYKLDDAGLRLLEVSRTAEARLLYCSYAYKTTGEQRYLEQVERDLQTVCNFKDWNSVKHFLDVGEMAAGVGLAYDWLYNDLSSSTKSLVRTALDNFAFQTIFNKQWSQNIYASTNNWNQVCNGGIVCAALAVYEDDKTDAQKLIEDALASNSGALETGYCPDGNYTEGYAYWDYGTIYEALWLTAMETATGSDSGLSSNSGFQKSGKYMVFMEGPSGYAFNYSDGDQTYLGGMALWYFAWKYNDTSVLFLEKDRVSAYISAESYRMLPLIAWYAARINVADIAAPTDKIFHGDGSTPVVLAHETWTMDEDDKFLGIVGGKGTTTHAHLDAGSFVYDAEGVRWASDLGKQDYQTLEPYIDLWNTGDGCQRWTVFRLNNYNHNTLTVNDTYHLSAGFGSFTEVIDSGGKKGAVIDITAPLANEVSSAVRTIYMEGDDLVIEDRIVALGSKAAEVRWTMVTSAEPTIEYGEITLKQDRKTRYLVCDSGQQLTWKTWEAKGTNTWDAANPGMYECGYTYTINAGNSATITMRLTPNDPLE